jgi:hypothetical protein
MKRKLENEDKIIAELKMLLHASRDCLRNQKIDTTKVSYYCSDSYYAEAFGMLRCLAIMGYGDLRGAINVDYPGNLKIWFRKIEDEVLVEENFYGNNECHHCFEKYGKDAMRQRRMYVRT